MVADTVDGRTPRPLLTLGPVDLVRVQVGYRVEPEGAAYQHFLLDVPVPEPSNPRDRGGVDDARILAALEPVLYAGAERPRHYSVHQHRWHTSWGPSPGALEIGILVTTGAVATLVLKASRESVTRAFRDLLEVVGRPAPVATSRDTAILTARRSAATAYALDPEALSLSVEEHRPAENSWTVGLRATSGEEYDVVVGLVDGYARSVEVRRVERVEVFDSVGSE